MNGFLEIIIKGVKYTLKFGMYALKLMVEKRGISLDELDKLFQNTDNDKLKNYDLFIDLLEAGIKNHALIEGKSCDLNYFKLYDDCSDLDESKALEVYKAFFASQGIEVDPTSKDEGDKPASKKK